MLEILKLKVQLNKLNKIKINNSNKQNKRIQVHKAIIVMLILMAEIIMEPRDINNREEDITAIEMSFDFIYRSANFSKMLILIN